MLLLPPCLAWPCSAPRERAKSISQDVVESLRYLSIPKYCFVTLNPTLAPKMGTVPRMLSVPFVGVLLQPSSVPVPRLTNNLQPGMSTAINRLISSDLEKDILVFGRPTVACPEPWAGASAAGGAGDALSQEYPAPCSVSPHKNSFSYASSCSLLQLQDPCRHCGASPLTSSLKSPR